MGRVSWIGIGMILVTAQVFAGAKKIEVFPVLFIPNDAHVTQARLIESAVLLQKHLSLAQQHYSAILKTDSFNITGQKFPIYRAMQSYQFYLESLGSDTAHQILRELFTWQKDDRMNSNRVYLTIVARPEGVGPELATLGGGRTFNGPPGSGGGYIEMEWSSLLRDRPYSFQSTLVHELGHAFGLTHAECYGYDMTNNDSIMSYNSRHTSTGLVPGQYPGMFNAEEYFALSQNLPAFPDFQYVEKIHNPLRRNLELVENCYLSPMTDYIGKISQTAGKGYELFFNGKKVNTPDAVFYTLKQAKHNCVWNHENQKGMKIACRYDGVQLNLQ